MKTTWLETCNEVYEHLQDDTSRDIFIHRLNYAVTRDKKHLVDMVRMLPEAKRLYSLPTQKSYIFGAGYYGQKTRKFLPMEWMGFIDNDNQKWGGYCDGLPILSPADAPHDATIFLANRYHHAEIYQQLRNAGFADAQLVNLGKIIDEMAQKQYFDLEALPHAEKESFADVGALNGETAKEFLRWAGDTADHVWCFEPDARNAEKCRTTLPELEKAGKLTVVPKGAWSEHTTLSFCAQANGISAVGAGDDTVETTTLDKVFADEPITFIKMDIEGAEFEALRGCECTIRTQRPKLAISVYHKPGDIVDLAQLILAYQPDYRLYLRHYCIFDNETVLYAI